VSQVRRKSSNSGTYLCSMQGNSCKIWTLMGMFPSRYRVSSFEGYKQGYNLVEDAKLLRKMVYNAKRESTIGSIL
jgi:hypothetical protein